MKRKAVDAGQFEFVLAGDMPGEERPPRDLPILVRQQMRGEVGLVAVVGPGGEEFLLLLGGERMQVGIAGQQAGRVCALLPPGWRNSRNVIR